mgnify:CR=1 FL=1
MHTFIFTPEFRRYNITTIEEANEFLKTYIPKFNKKFSIEPKDKKSSFMKLPKYVNLDYLLSGKNILEPSA